MSEAIVRVVCAANRTVYRDQHGMQRVLVIPGIRHYDKGMVSVMKAVLGTVLKDGEEVLDKSQIIETTQGFLDSKGQYLTREEAMVVARNNQTLYREPYGNGEELYSENLY